VKKILFFKIILINIFSIANSAESGGMPQLNPEFWFSQIFWLTISFGILFLILSKFILPKIRNNLENRKSQIIENIEISDRQKKDSENKLQQYEKIISETKAKANNIFNSSKEKVKSDLDKKRLNFDEEINKNIENIEKEIVELKNSSLPKINSIAVETSTEIIKKLLGEDINKSNITAIVDEEIKLGKAKS
tara:strand:+ start:157 stop:732 length:576 start_codon:yes stop_codon:yes gene_type:complete